MKVFKDNLANLIDYSIDYYKDLKKRFSAGKERKTEIKVFDNITASKVIIANKKLYADFKEGFIGYSLKKAETIMDCSEIDDIILFFKSGKMMVTKVSDKKFVGKDIVYASVWKKGDTRTIYHVLYQDGSGGACMMKRFRVNSITRDKEYDLTKGNKGSKLLYFSSHPNGEREIISVSLRPRPHLKKLRFDIDLGELIIKGRGAAGNRVTKEIVQKVVQKEVGGSTLESRKIWFDEVVGRLNDDERGKFIGSFKGDDKILTLYKNGDYRLCGFDLSTYFDDDMIHIEKWHPERSITALYFDSSKDTHYVKRFKCEITTDKRVLCISETKGSSLHAFSTAFETEVKIVYNKLFKETKNLPDNIVKTNDIIDVKGMKAQGNQLTKLKVKEIVLTHSIEGETPWPKEEVAESKEPEVAKEDDTSQTMEWDIKSEPNDKDADDQISLF